MILEFALIYFLAIMVAFCAVRIYYKDKEIRELKNRIKELEEK